jgi:hypothetical protein
MMGRLNIGRWHLIRSRMDVKTVPWKGTQTSLNVYGAGERPGTGRRGLPDCLSMAAGEEGPGCREGLMKDDR